MKLSDLMSKMGLHTYAEVALVIFFVVFLAVIVAVLRRDRRADEHASRLPLDDGDAENRR
jgi:cbb3-type cytochrome oxidase subunit 3